jgi:phospholipid/cholesterol/gamma-HCH transport system permease protein
MVGAGLLGINPTYLWYNMVHYTNMDDVMTGMIKTFVFGAIIAVIACDKGLNCPQGAEGVGRATTEAVVYSSITILITNFFLTLVLNKWLP